MASNNTIHEKLAALEVWRWAIAEKIRHNMQTVSFEELANQCNREREYNATPAALEEVSEWFNWDLICKEVG